MIEKITSILSSMGETHVLIRKNFEIGKEAPELEDIRIKKILEEERKKVQPVYNIKGEIIEYDKHGRHLDVES